MLRKRLRSRKTLLSVIIFLFVNVSVIFYLVSRNVPERKDSKALNRMQRDISHTLRLSVTTIASKPDIEGVIQIVCICNKEKQVYKLLKFVKSLLLYRTHPLHLHILTDDVTYTSVSVLFNTWNLPSFELSIYREVDYQKKLSLAGNVDEDYQELLKLELHRILPPNVNEVIFYDLDIMMMHDIYKLWILFANFNESQAMGITPEMKVKRRGNEEKTPNLQKINTGMILYRLSTLRKIDWSHIWQKELKSSQTKKESRSLVPEDIMNILRGRRPNMFYNVSCVWNAQLGQNVDYNICPVQRGYKAVQATAKEMYSISQHEFPMMPLYQKTLEAFMAIDGYRFSVRSTPYHRVLPFLIKSNRSTQRNDNNITLVLHAEPHQLKLLHQVADRWAGPVSAVMVGSDSEMSKLVSLNFERNVDYHYAFKKKGERELPRGLLRNIAMSFARSNYVMVTELNTWFPPYTYNTALLFLKNSNNLDVVGISDFKTKCRLERYPKTKQELLDQISQGEIVQSEHEKVMYKKWIETENSFNGSWPSTSGNSLIIKRSSLDCLKTIAVSENFDQPCYNSLKWVNTTVAFLPSKLKVMTLTPERKNCFYTFD